MAKYRPNLFPWVVGLVIVAFIAGLVWVIWWTAVEEPNRYDARCRAEGGRVIKIDEKRVCVTEDWRVIPIR